MKKHTQHSWGLLLLIAAKSANIDMLNRLASLITGQVNMATAADPQGYPVRRRVACVFHILKAASAGLDPAKDPIRRQGIRNTPLVFLLCHSFFFFFLKCIYVSDCLVCFFLAVQLQSGSCGHYRSGFVSHSDNLSNERHGCRCSASLLLNISMLVGSDKTCWSAISKSGLGFRIK